MHHILVLTIYKSLENECMSTFDTAAACFVIIIVKYFFHIPSLIITMQMSLEVQCRVRFIVTLINGMLMHAHTYSCTNIDIYALGHVLKYLFVDHLYILRNFVVEQVSTKQCFDVQELEFLTRN